MSQVRKLASVTTIERTKVTAVFQKRPHSWLCVWGRLVGATLVAVLHLTNYCSCTRADVPYRFHMDVDVLEWFGSQKEPSFSDSSSEIGLARLSRDGDVWLYELSSQFVDENARASRSIVLHEFRTGGEKAVFASFNAPERSVRSDSDLLFVNLADTTISRESNSKEIFPNNGDGCLLAFSFLHQKPIFGGAESWLNQAIPGSTDSIRKEVARDIEISVHFLKEDNQVVLKKCVFVFGPEAFWDERRTKDRLVGSRQIAIQECKIEYEVTTSGQSSFGECVPTEWKSRDTLLLVDQTVVVNSKKYRLKAFSTEPINQREFWNAANIPLGHSVAVESAPQLAYVWNGDWAVPESELLATTKFSSVGAIWRTIGLIALIAIPVFVWSVSRKRGQDRVGKQPDAILKNNRRSNQK